MDENQIISQKISDFQKRLRTKERELKRPLKERKQIEEELLKFSREDLEKKKKDILREEKRLKREIEKIEKKEEKIKTEKQKIEEKEENEEDWAKKRKFEEQRWKVELKERNLERKKWGLEDQIEAKEKEMKIIRRGLEKENELRENLRKIKRTIEETRSDIDRLKQKIKEIRELEKEFEQAWKDYLFGNTSSALEKLREIQRKISEKTKIQSEQAGPEEPDNKKKEFFEPLEHYQKGEVTPAIESLKKLLEKIETKPSPTKKQEDKTAGQTGQEQKQANKTEESEKVAAKKSPPIIINNPPQKISEEIKEKPPLKKSEGREKKIEKPPLIIVKEKEGPQEALEKFEKELKEEREKLIEEEKEKLKQLREELEKKQEEALRAALEKRKPILGKEPPRALQEELIRKELEIEREYQERLRSQKEKLEKKKNELLQAEKSLPLIGLTEEERKKREEIIRSLRQKVEEERVRIENKELAEEKEREFAKERRLKVLEDVFEQALSFYNEKELEKAKRVFSIVKDQIEQGKKLGTFVNLNNIPIYAKSAYFIKKIDEEAKTTQQKATKVQKPQVKQLQTKRRNKKRVLFSWRKSLSSLKQILFPLPIIGLDLSDYSLKLLYLNKKKGVVALSRQVLEPGVLIDGKVKNPRSFSKSLALLLKTAGFPPFQPKKGGVTKAIVSLPSSAVYTLIFRFKIANYIDLFREVKEKLEETFPFSLEEIYWDYLVCGKDNSERVKIVCIAAQRDVIDTLVYSLRANGIEPIALDVGMFAIKRAILPRLPFKKRFGILDIGGYITTFDIFDEKGFVEFSTSMPYAGHDFQVEIAKSLKISMEKAEKMIIQQGLQKSPTKEILGKEIEKIANEIKEATQRYQGTFKGEIKKIILTGGGSSLSGIVPSFKKFLPSLDIRIENSFLKIKIKRSLSLSEQLLFTGALGLSLRAISKNPIREGINLLPEELKRKEREVRLAFIKKKLLLIKIILGVLGGVLAVLALYYLSRRI